MCNILKILENYNFDTPPQNIDSKRIMRWGKNNRFWIKRFDGGYVFGDFVSGLSTHAFDKNEYTKIELKKMQKSMKRLKERQKSNCKTFKSAPHQELKIFGMMQKKFLNILIFQRKKFFLMA